MKKNSPPAVRFREKFRIFEALGSRSSYNSGNINFWPPDWYKVQYFPTLMSYAESETRRSVGVY